MIRGSRANVSINIQGCTMGLEAIVTGITKDVAIDKQVLSGRYL